MTEEGAVLGEETLMFYGAGGERLAEFQISAVQTFPGYYLRLTERKTLVWFGSKLLRDGKYNVVQDRLGSVRWRHDITSGQTETVDYYPYGQEKPGATMNDREKFATYLRDSETGLDYADRRYHQPGWGRFLTPDPYQASGGPGSPGSWNRYAYVEGDPVGHNDPKGLLMEDPCAFVGCLMAPPDMDGPGTGGGGIIWAGGPLCVFNSWLPIPMCLVPVALAPQWPQQEEQTCDAEMPTEADGRAAVATVMGENSYSRIGKQAYSFGDSYKDPSVPVITRDTVRTESQMIVSVLINRSNTRGYGGNTISQAATAKGQFLGYGPGLKLIDEALTKKNGDPLCERLRWTIDVVSSVLANPAAYATPYFNFKAVVNEDNVVRRARPGEFWVAGTAFQP